ncbi:MAG: HAMP domain-containing protein [Verrucomicrobia bacterium]|nr:HAMP domain-containing protein [Verrucomicrobiota bacterium]
MNGSLTLERRVTVWSAVVVACSLFVCGGGGAWFLYHQEVAQLDRRLQQVAAQFFEQRRLHGGAVFDLGNQHEIMEWLPAPGSEVVVEVEQGGRIYFRSPRLGSGQLPRDFAGFRYLELPIGRMRAGAVQEEGITLRIAAPTQPLDELLGNLVLVFAAGFPLMLGFVVVGGRAIARQALVPVRRIADTAEQITSQRFDRRVPVPDPPDEIRRLALVLNTTFDRLEGSYRQAQHFSADASHELKTPLTLVHAELEALLASPHLVEADRAAVANALESAKRLGSITTSLLLLAQADAGRLQLDLETLDLAEVVRDCLDDARILADAAGLALQTTLPDSLSVRGDATRLRQIICNLMHNAVKYNQAGGWVGLRLAEQGAEGWLEVANSGPGIPAAHAPYVFDRFYRAEHHAAVAGHGLGLAIARELSRAHGGRLELIRSDSAETVFRLTLPLVAGSAPSRPQPPNR